MAVFPRGSEWRRWDLHIHAPGTALGDRFKDWDSYLSTIERADSTIAVVGITDYANIRTYKEFRQHQQNQRATNILAVPNIEFRISPETKDGRGINIHLLISPDDPDHVQRIEEALARLTLQRSDENISCTVEGLVRLGRLTNPTLASNEAAFKEGANQFKVAFDPLRRWYEEEKWLNRNSLVALAAGTKDGASGLIDGGFKATKREIYAFAQVIFSANPKDREAWLGRGGIPEDEFATLKVPKPVLHGSDAHSIERLFKPDFDRYCWIKADPTFEGLRQILYEPEDRVWIGETPPTTYENRAVIRSVTLEQTNGWFDERSIPLNPGLVAIIGSKGSGKTALADLIALACGADLDEQDSFVSRAGDYINGLCVKLDWYDGTEATAAIPEDPSQAPLLRAKYLSQKFVNTLCSQDTLSTALNREVESVIFNHLPIEDQLEAADFSDLRALKTAGIRGERQDLVADVEVCNKNIAELDERAREIEAKAGRRSEIPVLLKALQKALPAVDDKDVNQKLARLNGLKSQSTALSQSIAELKATKQQAEDAERKILGQMRQFWLSWSDMERTLRNLGFDDEALAGLRPQLPLTRQADMLTTGASAIFSARYKAIDRQIKELQSGTLGERDDQTSAKTLDVEIKKLEGELKFDESKKRKLLDNQSQIRQLLDEQKKITKEFKWLDENRIVQRRAIQERRLASYLRFFDLLDQEREILEQLYTPLKAALSGQGSHEQKLGMVCRTEVDVTVWLRRGEDLFDLRKSGASAFTDIKTLAKGALLRAWKECKPEAIRSCLNQCLDSLGPEVKSSLKIGYELRNVADWLFSVDHIKLVHGLQYEGKDLRSLSPGTKGIALLILYLAVDKQDTRPLLIDQPDENLDSQSTFDVLRSYFREAKKRRQIIIITHNPNLVVNTDAEQVIVAENDAKPTGLPFIAYSAGGLEALKTDGRLDGSIREAVCRIMEGGREAFRMRQLRYRE